MLTMLNEFNSLEQLERAFPDEASCVAHFRALRWPDGMSCVHCGSMDRIYTMARLGNHKCGDCRREFTVRHNTIFGDSKFPLRLWFKAIFLMTSHKKGISSCQLARDLGVTQKSAWFMLHRVRNAANTTEFNEPLPGMRRPDTSSFVSSASRRGFETIFEFPRELGSGPLLSVGRGPQALVWALCPIRHITFPPHSAQYDGEVTPRQLVALAFAVCRLAIESIPRPP